MLLVTLGTKFAQGQGGGAIDPAQICGNLLALFPADITQRMSYLMHDTQLNLRMWIYSLDGLWKPFEPVNTGNQNILQPSVLQFIRH